MLFRIRTHSLVLFNLYKAIGFLLNVLKLKRKKTVNMKVDWYRQYRF